MAHLKIPTEQGPIGQFIEEMFMKLFAIFIWLALFMLLPGISRQMASDVIQYLGGKPGWSFGQLTLCAVLSLSLAVITNLITDPARRR